MPADLPAARRPARDRRPARLRRLNAAAAMWRAAADADPTDVAAAELAAAYERETHMAALEAARDEATRNEARARTDATADKWAAIANGYVAELARLRAGG